MAKLVINKSLVNKDNASTLVNLCPFNAIEYNDNILSINENCKLCKLCTKKGPSGVITLEEEMSISIDKSKYNGICVFVEIEDEIHPVVFELLSKAYTLSRKINHELLAVMISTKELIEKYKQQVLMYGVDHLYIYEDDAFKDFTAELYSKALFDFVEKVKPSTILFGGTHKGRSLAPRVASHFKTGLTADCTHIDVKDNTDLIQVRPAFGGNIMAQIQTTKTRPQLATVRYKVFKDTGAKLGLNKVTNMTLFPKLSTYANVIKKYAKPKEDDITKADVIVCIGNAFKTADDIELATNFANKIGATLSCSRPLVEAGLMNARYQIGLSGKSVAPKLLITLGVSGAIQFRAGITSSEVIIAVNNDPNALIFDVAHYSIIDDVFSFMKETINSLK